MKQIKHLHHIIPKHMGGSDDPSNLVELTIEEHAEAHRKLFLEHGYWEDEIAWKGLAGIIGKEQIVSDIISKNNSEVQRNLVATGKHHFTDSNFQKSMVNRQIKNGTHVFTGGKIQKESNKRRLDNGTHHLLGGSMHRKCITNGTFHSQREHTCPFCNKRGKGNAMLRHHFNNCKVKDANTNQ